MSSTFGLVCRTLWNGRIGVTKYKSSLSGLSVCICDVAGPNVYGSVVVGTESPDDDGLPHTLEHLVFMGSQKYPYRGLLDILANRCLADGTNAYTMPDHTCFELTTAGSSGFLQILPIYLEFICFPQLTEAQFLTEVHHVDGEGMDAGVVYCEMQEREADPANITELCMREKFYPPGCGYRVECGGRLAAIRSTNNSKVKDFHQRFYQPTNMSLIVVGIVDHQELFDALQPIDLRLKQLVDSTSGTLNPPWKTPFARLSETVETTVVCPSDDESRGHVRFAWNGPDIREQYVCAALEVLLEYLSDSPVAPLQRDLVEVESPYCGEIAFDLDDIQQCRIDLKLGGVPVDKLNCIKDRTLATLQGIICGKEKLDMSRIGDIIQRSILSEMSVMEDSPHSVATSSLISDFLFFETETEFSQALNEVEMLKRLANEPQDYWRSLLESWLSDQLPHVYIIGQPSQKEVGRLADLEGKRLAAQVERLGPEGLRRCAEQLELAVEENEVVEVPEEMFAKICVKNLDSVKFHRLQSSCNFIPGRANDVEGFPIGEFSFPCIFQDVKTDFVHMALLLDSSYVSANLRPLIHVLLELLFESPLERDGVVLPYETVVKELNSELITYSAGLGVNGHYLRIVNVFVKCSLPKYQVGVKLLQELMQKTVFTPERIRVVSQRRANSFVAIKQDGEIMNDALNIYLSSIPGSNASLSIPLKQEVVANELLRRLKVEPTKVVEDFNNLRAALVAEDRVVVHIVGNSQLLAESNPNPASPWLNGFKSSASSPTAGWFPGKQKEPQYLKATRDWGVGAILPVGSCDSTFILQTTTNSKLPNWTDYQSLPALLVAAQYFTQSEGPFYQRVRGRGLAYDARIVVEPDDGTVQLAVYRTANPLEAYVEAEKCVKDILEDPEELDECLFEAAKSSLIFELVSLQSTVPATTIQSLLSYYRRIPDFSRREILEKIWAVSEEEMLEAVRERFAPVFDFSTTNMAVTCHPAKVEEIREGFKQLGRTLTTISIDDKDLCAV